MTVTALLGPTNTGKTHRAIERMLEHESGMIGLPLRLLAREVYDRVTAQLGERRVALVTGEEKRVPPHPSYWVCTVESMPIDREVDFLCVDEVQLAAHRQRGHTFTDRLLHARGRRETWLLGSDTMRPLIEHLLPAARIHRHPRLSQLSYTGTHSLASLPPRTAVVAFSADEVYAIAERLRRRHGGTAVVLGALSPRTRNAQVAMYQAGEVGHMVATDAIGMGLNMDVDRVVFASLDKFDGREHRPLELAELAQIAGRAGRYTTDGGFGTLRPLPGLPPRVVAAVEQHRFAPVQRLVWRNPELDLSSLDGLVASLRAQPRRRALRRVEQADDFEALLRLSRLEVVRQRARDPESIALLWDVCRIPDFRKLLLDSHVQLLATIYEQLSGPSARLDRDWMATRIRRLEPTDGDIPTLMARIAFVRTWTYICHHATWVEDAGHWQALTREIEDRQSDALHERLTERFVDAPGERLVRSSRARRRVRSTTGEVAAVPVDGSPFAALQALSDDLPDRAGELASAVSSDRRVDAIVEAPHEAFALDERLRIVYEDEALGVLRAGADLTRPEVVVAPGLDLAAGAQLRIVRRLQAWIRDAVDELLAPLPDPAGDLGPAARGLAYQLRRGLGTVARADAAAQLSRLSAEDRRRLVEAGIVFARRTIHAPALARPDAIRLRAALWLAERAPPIRPELPVPGAVSVPVVDIDPAWYTAIGFVPLGPRAIRQDQVERALDRLAELGEGPFELPPEIGGWLAGGRRTLVRVLGALGFRRGPAGWTAPRRRRRRRKRRGPPAHDRSR